MGEERVGEAWGRVRGGEGVEEGAGKRKSRGKKRGAGIAGKDTILSQRRHTTIYEVRAAG